jgi:hypothetical protein
MTLASRRRLARWEKTLALLLAALALFVGPLLLVHDTTQLHEVCHEHGEVVDVTAQSRAQAPRHEDRPRWDAARDSEAHHDHCLLATLVQPSGEALHLRAWGESRVEAAVPAKTPGSEVRLVSVPLLCLAPKQSPPV